MDQVISKSDLGLCPLVKGSLWVVQGLCVVWLVVVGFSRCVLGGCEVSRFGGGELQG